MDCAGQNRRWIEETLCRLVLEAPENLLADYGGQPIFARPLVGVADGDDPAFERVRQAVGERCLMPRDILQRQASGARVEKIRVVVWALPFAQAIRESNRRPDFPAPLYSLARNNGGALNHLLWARMAEALRARGALAAAPELQDDYTAYRDPRRVFTSTWSERHAAWVAGMGRFGLSGALITAVGSSVRFGSVVTDMDLEPTHRPDDDYRAPCLRDGGLACGRCIARCPMGAISAAGLDKNLCNRMRHHVKEQCAEAYAAALQMMPAPIVTEGRSRQGLSLGCALCQCGVPCESATPCDCVREGKSCSTSS